MLKNKKGAEIPVTIFVICVIMLLFLTLGISMSKKRVLNAKASGITGIQEAYTMENVVKYGVKRAFEKAVEESYNSVVSDGSWIAGNCKKNDKSDYKNLCAFNENVYNEMKNIVEENFGKNIKTIEEVNPIFSLTAREIEGKLKDKSVFFEADDEKAIIKIIVSLILTDVEEKYWEIFGLKLMKRGEVLDHYFRYKPEIRVEKNFVGLGIAGFKKIFLSAEECKSRQENEIKGCIENKLENFEVFVRVIENEVYFELKSKREFDFGKIVLKFFVEK